MSKTGTFQESSNSVMNINNDGKCRKSVFELQQTARSMVGLGLIRISSPR